MLLINSVKQCQQAAVRAAMTRVSDTVYLRKRQPCNVARVKLAIYRASLLSRVASSTRYIIASLTIGGRFTVGYFPDVAFEIFTKGDHPLSARAYTRKYIRTRGRWLHVL